jgi:hypothetical protein
MAKKKAARPRPADAPETRPDVDEGPLADAIAVFASGDYVAARRALEPLAGASTLSEGQRARARELLAATRPEPTALKVGLACLGLMGLIAIVLGLTQP